jgi:hypothetical protein
MSKYGPSKRFPHGGLGVAAFVVQPTYGIQYYVAVHLEHDDDDPYESPASVVVGVRRYKTKAAARKAYKSITSFKKALQWAARQV